MERVADGEAEVYSPSVNLTVDWTVVVTNTLSHGRNRSQGQAEKSEQSDV
jgi:hypothetical protein